MARDDADEKEPNTDARVKKKEHAERQHVRLPLEENESGNLFQV